jgi:hypothetical protein
VSSDFRVKNEILNLNSKTTKITVNSFGLKFILGYHCCPKCEVEGQWVNHRMTFADTSSVRRSNDSFRNRTDGAFHHSNAPSPFEKLQIDMIETFPIDYMHNICLGKKKLSDLIFRICKFAKNICTGIT